MAKRKNNQTGIIILKKAASVMLKIKPARKYANMRSLAGRFCRQARTTLRYPQKITIARPPTPSHPRFAKVSRYPLWDWLGIHHLVTLETISCNRGPSQKLSNPAPIHRFGVR